MYVSIIALTISPFFRIHVVDCMIKQSASPLFLLVIRKSRHLRYRIENARRYIACNRGECDSFCRGIQDIRRNVEALVGKKLEPRELLVGPVMTLNCPVLLQLRYQLWRNIIAPRYCQPAFPISVVGFTRVISATLEDIHSHGPSARKCF